MTDRKLKIAVVCSSNQNRSMEAHNFLSKKGFQVRSFGSGTHVKLPGPSPQQPNIYDFNTTYDEMYRDLVAKDKQLYPLSDLPTPKILKKQEHEEENGYTQNGILHMIDRNRRIKSRPERFQSCKDRFELIVTCEERVYDQVLEDIESKERENPESVHVVNIDIQDNHEEAVIGAFMICDLCALLSETDDLDNDVDELLQEFEAKCQRPILHTVAFY